MMKMCERNNYLSATGDDVNSPRKSVCKNSVLSTHRAQVVT